MGLFNSINISATGLSAERTRMEVISKNIANANTTRTSSGGPYRRQIAIFKEKSGQSFADILNGKTKGTNKGVRLSKIAEDESPLKRVYDPGHPDADQQGYVQMPNVDVIKEMVDMITATRAYEANVTAMNATKSMALKALDIGR
ncbi:flagellar basal body rod protein FlgC [Clostridiaceae bacterium M8S5]|nr:flagellar basal body rod protein FlgC [Clostridiaceae bacterium M8S5]